MKGIALENRVILEFEDTERRPKSIKGGWIERITWWVRLEARSLL